MRSEPHNRRFSSFIRKLILQTACNVKLHFKLMCLVYMTSMHLFFFTYPYVLSSRTVADGGYIADDTALHQAVQHGVFHVSREAVTAAKYSYILYLQSFLLFI